MSVMARLQKSGMFQCVAQVLLSTVGRAWQLMVPVVILQTVAVNLASTLTPIGNPKSLSQLVSGHEVLAGVAASQVISNVPAALLLSGFTGNLSTLIIGVNLDGLGALIASMASLISYKLIAREESQVKGAYFRYFAVANVCFLAILLVFTLTEI